MRQGGQLHTAYIVDTPVKDGGAPGGKIERDAEHNTALKEDRVEQPEK